ncbi:transglutaminase-like domain-containing protein [Tetragenococcus koreensis]|uniref:transglutaminase-like domain-containing protein n=1 Tax=Tetragenococcus koreensis TaxID=290335 RepID=UPI000F4F0E1B|nr:transglutaminase-like domain-containing protein [Tetragenococcus koreensis]AYW46014.1 transglutaminase [Tetragenococcus koreensis]MCF1584674.1 transglutaminase-like domain-containing protein [Tetragenococcus koreensis]MCF1614296.1 transglutaminase-like domain-containing protein [Tetragenococcus koreensis]MCF1624068.1 transglutaminase-like domain-containing protein [Tetragenococcus koreensis]MCF1629003.1 transglutaminase-like domain-containing protein [Tetragenococcus koreensis]
MKPYELNDISYLSIPLPDDITRAKENGNFTLAEELIREKLNFAKTSQTLKQRLEGELAVLSALGEDQFPFDEQQAQKMLEEAFEKVEPDEIQELVRTNNVEWTYKKGQKYFHRRFIENLVKTRHDYYERYRYEEENSIDNERQTELDDNIIEMKKNGQRKAKITLKQSIAPSVTITDQEGPFLAHLPLPRTNGHVNKQEVFATTGPVLDIANPTACQRTIAFQTDNINDLFFEVKHEYEIKANYHDLFDVMENQKDFPKKLSDEEKKQFQNELAEKSPHILFTDFLDKLLAEMTTKEMNLLEKAYKIYEFVTTKVNYSYMREYFTIPNISEYCAVNQKGDCGVQAILFITLCRMAGIPAKWESGLYISEYTQGPHDWAKFYLPTIGWVYADASFGGSAYRGHNTERWKYYFGNLDVFRMPANDDIQADFTVAKKQLRADPIDNQRGEFESNQRSFRFNELDWNVTLIGFEFL